MVEVGLENHRLVLFPDSQSENSFLLRNRAPREGLGMPLSDDVLPRRGNAIKGVYEAVVVAETKGEGGGVDLTAEAETAAGDGETAAEVELDGVVKLVGADAVNLCYLEVAVGGEEAESAVGELEKS